MARTHTHTHTHTHTCSSSSVLTAKLKLEDRLAAAAREKLAQASKECKEKQLQAERKRKAALFLQTLRSEPEAKRAPPDPGVPEVGGAWPGRHGERARCQRRRQLGLIWGRWFPQKLPSEPSGHPQKQPSSTDKQAARRSRDTRGGGARDKKKKKSKRRSRSRSRSRARSRSRSRSKAKSRHSLPSAYRRERRARWDPCRSPQRSPPLTSDL